MKSKTLADRKSGSRTLQLRCGKGDVVDYARAEWLRGLSQSVLLPFRWERKGKGGTFYYDITECESLWAYLQRGLSGEQYRSLLHSFGRLADFCAKDDAKMEDVLFDAEHVYVAEGRLRFAYVPCESLAAPAVSPLALLSILSDTRYVRFSLSQDAQLAQQLADFTQRSNVFSAFEYSGFLASLLGGNDAEMTSSNGNGATDFANEAAFSGTSVVFDPFAQSTTQPSMSDIVSGVATESTHDAPAKQPPAIPFDSGTQTLATTPTIANAAPSDAPAQPLSKPMASVCAPAAPASYVLIRECDGSQIGAFTASATIGRSSQCTLRIAGNTNVSRTHATITVLDGNRLALVDLGSSNGTTVRGRLLHKGETAEITRGERFEVADERLHVA